MWNLVFDSFVNIYRLIQNLVRNETTIAGILHEDLLEKLNNNSLNINWHKNNVSNNNCREDHMDILRLINISVTSAITKQKVRRRISVVVPHLRFITCFLPMQTNVCIYILEENWTTHSHISFNSSTCHFPFDVIQTPQSKYLR